MSRKRTVLLDGAVVRRRRESLGFNVGRLADKIGINNATVYKIELNQHRVPITSAIRLAEALGARVEDIAVMDDEKTATLLQDVDAGSRLGVAPPAPLTKPQITSELDRLRADCAWWRPELSAAWLAAAVGLSNASQGEPDLDSRAILLEAYVRIRRARADELRDASWGGLAELASREGSPWRHAAAFMYSRVMYELALGGDGADFHQRFQMLRRAVVLLDGIPAIATGVTMPEPELLIGVRSELGEELLSFPYFGDPLVRVVPRGRRYAADFSLQLAYAASELGNVDATNHWLARAKVALAEVPAAARGAPHVAVNLELIRAKERTLRAAMKPSKAKVKSARDAIERAQDLMARHLSQLLTVKRHEWSAALAGCLLVVPDYLKPSQVKAAIDEMIGGGSRACSEEPLLFRALTEDAISRLAVRHHAASLDEFLPTLRTVSSPASLT